MSDTKLNRRALLQSIAGTAMVALGRHAAGHADAMFQNPLFAGDFADPSILRIGSDFYLTHTSYRYSPGLVIWHSRDLVNWLPISSALPVLHGDGEVWAPDFVEHQGQYYIYYPQNGRLFVVHTPNPGGTWSAPVDLGINSIDPGHVVAPDGTRYLYFGAGEMIQLSADGMSTVGTKRRVYEGWQFPRDWKTEGFWQESTKLTRRNGFYYLTCAEGGTSGPPTSHMAVVARSKSPVGPWENSPYNPLIHTYNPDETWWSVGHGTLVSTPDDRWYFVYHGYRNGFQTLGRHILVEPVDWTSDGWPRAMLGARRDQPMPAPMGVAQRPMISLSDDFRTPRLKPTWSVWDETDQTRYQVSGGRLSVRGKGQTPGKSSPLTVMARDPGYEIQVVVTPHNDGAGALGLFYNPNNWVFAELKRGRLRVYTAKETVADREWKASTAHLRITNNRHAVAFLASENGRVWQSLAADFDASGFTTNVLHGFQALRPALAASGGGEADFARFRYRRL